MPTHSAWPEIKHNKSGPRRKAPGALPLRDYAAGREAGRAERLKQVMSPWGHFRPVQPDFATS